MSHAQPPLHVDELHLQELERGHIHRLRLHTVENAQGLPVGIPLLVARGAKPGPVLGVTAAVHGNEVNGIFAIQHLFRQLKPSRLAGTVVAALLVNTPGFHRHQRRYADGTDLNTVFPGHPTGNAPQQFASRLLDKLVRHFDHLIDLHTASFGRVNSLYVRADMTDAQSAQMAYLMRPQVIAHKTTSDRTLRGSAMELGIPAATVEIGDPLRHQPQMVKTVSVGVRTIMEELGMWRRHEVAERPAPILCAASSWLYTQHGGLLTVYPGLCDVVAKGDKVGEVRNIYGDLLEELFAPAAGVVIGKSTNPVGGTGARVLHLGEVVADGQKPFHQRLPRGTLRTLMNAPTVG